jgi:hypothetical protein
MSARIVWLHRAAMAVDEAAEVEDEPEYRRRDRKREHGGAESAHGSGAKTADSAPSAPDATQM